MGRLGESERTSRRVSSSRVMVWPEEFEAERGEPSVPVFGQQRLEVGGVVEKPSLNHDFAGTIADVGMNEKS